MMSQISDDRIKFPDEVEPCVSKIPNSGIGVRCKIAINDGKLFANSVLILNEVGLTLRAFL